VAYGANGKFNYLNITGGTACTNALFGDPLVGTAKSCYIIDIAVQTPASPTPTPVAVVKVSPSDAWCNAINKATPGTDVILGPGSYSDPCSIKVSGKAGAPITIRSESSDSSKRAVLAYQGSSSNVIDLSGAFLTLRWLSFSPTQDSVDAIRIRSGSDIIIEQNSFTGIGGVSVAGNDSSLQRITIRDNIFKDLKYTVLYFGCQDGLACQASDIVVERNVIDGVTTPYDPSAVGYGVQVKLNSSATIRDNTIYRTKGPGIMVYGSNQGGPLSLLEGNYVEGSVEEGGIVVGGGPAIVRNNILVGNAYGGISAQDYNSRGLQKNIWIVHNTLLNNVDSGINVQNWGGSSGNVIAFNAIAPTSGTPTLRPANPAGTVTGNVNCNPASGCFEQPLRTPYSLRPLTGGPLMGAAGTGTEPWRPTDDFMGNARGSAADAGAMQKSSSQTAPLVGAGLARPSRNSSSSTPVAAIIAAPTPASHPPITATLLGQTGEDVVGTMSGTPDGIKDVHIKLSGVSGTIKGVRITGLDGIWETPANGKNWLVAIKPQSDPSVVDLYIDFCNFCKATTTYTLTVTFSDGATQALQALSTTPTPATVTTSTPVATAPPPPPSPASAPTPVVTAQAGTSGAASIVGLTPDPAGYSLGFARAHWTGSKMLVFFGNSHNSTGNNSVRAFDPASNAWEYLWPNSNGTDGLQNRDNHASLYVPRLDELWVWGGSGLENYGKAIGNPSVLAFCGGRFSVSQKRWLAKGTTADCYGAFSGVVQNFGGFHANVATAWSAEADMGVIFGGSGNGLYDDQWIIEPNPGGSQPYKMSEFLGSRPPARSQAQNLMVAVGRDFYLLGGYAGADVNGNWTFVNDLWKFSSATRTWTRLPNPPNVNYTPTLTYDSDRHALVAWVNDKIYVYSIASQQWADMTPVGLPCLFNQIGVYAPTAKLHLFEGGNRCSDAGSPGPQVYAVSLGTSSPQAVSAPTPASTIKATYLGASGEDKVGQINQTSANGKPDFHVSVSGLRGTPNKVTITSDTGGIWETPFNNQNWIIATQYSGQTGDLWFEQYASNKFHVKVRYADGTTDEADASNQVSPTLAPTPAPVVASPAPPTPAPTPAPAVTSPASPPPVAGWLNIPLRTWVSRPFAPAQLEARNEFIGQRGYGVDASKGAKHERLVYNTDNKRVYFYSGDYFVPPFASSFHTDMFSYDITKYINDASDAQNWILEWPYCGLPGEITPVHTDEGAFAWDSKRHIFWITAGSEVGSQDVVNMCGNGAIFYGASAISSSNPSGNAQHGFDILQFDPAKNRYIRPDAKYQMIPSSLKGSSQMPRHSVYNPVTDEIFMFGQGISGNVVYRMNAETGVWAVDALVCDAMETDCSNGRGYINDVFTIHEQPALDVEGQFIYLIDTYHKQDPDPNHRFRLVRYDIARHNMVSLGWIQLPDFGDPLKFPFYMPPYDSTMLAYDSINKVVLWPASSNEGRPILMIYHPDPARGKNGSWEIDPMKRDKPNEIVFGSNGTFIPELNALIIFGGFGTPNSDFFADHPGVSAPEHYFWLYRYGNGK
jgi:hypothetical protein